MKNIFNSGHLRHLGAVFLVMVLVTEVAAVAVKSPISRVGGKYRLAKQIIALFPEHDVYVEPFFGAGHVFFTKEPAKIEVINDIDGELVNFFRVVRFHAEEFERQISYFLRSKQMFDELEREPKLTDVQRAVTWYFSNRASYSAMGRNFRRAKSPNLGCVPKLAVDFQEIARRLERTAIESAPYEEILERYDRLEVLFYLDPPYTGLSNPYPFEWSEEEENRLWRVLAALKGRWLVSWGGRFPEELKSYRVVETTKLYTVNRPRRAKEWLVMNY